MKKLCSKGFKVSSADKKALDYYLLDTPKEWATKALQGMINKSVKTILRNWLQTFKDQSTGDIPASMDKLIPEILKMKEFKKYENEATEKKKAQRDESKTIEIWEGGFDVEDFEYEALNAFYKDPEQTLIDYMENKIALRKEKFVKEHEDQLFKDPNVLTIPSRHDAIIDLVTKKDDYKTRKEKEKKKEDS
jgi:hypothetical protein